MSCGKCAKMGCMAIILLPYFCTFSGLECWTGRARGSAKFITLIRRRGLSAGRNVSMLSWKVEEQRGVTEIKHKKLKTKTKFAQRKYTCFGEAVYSRTIAEVWAPK